MQHFHCDLLVVGGGGGALRAAIAAKEKYPGACVLVATKGVLGKSGVTAIACSDRMAFHATLPHTPPQGEEAWRCHADDIFRIGGYVSDLDLSEILARNSEEAYRYLDNLGVPFVKENGRPLQFVTDGSEYPRACYTGPRTAVHIEEGLMRRFRQLDIGTLEHCMVAKLVMQDGRITGALALNTRERESPEKALKVIQANSIILATGGAGRIFKHNVFPAGLTGDGCALAYEAGAELVNMEFIQIGVASEKTKLNCSGSMMRVIPRVIDEKGQEFLKDYFPEGTPWHEIYDLLFRKGASWPVSYEHDTHLIDVAVYKKMKEGRKVYLDYNQNPEGFIFTELPPAVQERYHREVVQDLGAKSRQDSPINRLREINPDSIQWLHEHGIDLQGGDAVEIAVCGQHFQGGVKIREKADTTVPGLYCVGEAAGGQHGANRPGGNALLDTQVFGRIAGETAAARALELGGGFIPRAEIDLFLKELAEAQGVTSGMPAKDYRKELQTLVESCVGVVRTEEGLAHGLARLRELAGRKTDLGVMPFAYGLENRSMTITAEMVFKAALLRDESRGPHLRFASEKDNTPIPRKDPRWQKYIVISKKDRGMFLEERAPSQGEK